MKGTSSSTGTGKRHHADSDIEVYIMHGDNDAIYILHDRPFQKALSWLEYNIATGQMEFVMEDGDLRDFGIPVSSEIGKHLHNTHTIPVAEIEDGQYKNGHYLPLILRTD